LRSDIASGGFEGGSSAFSGARGNDVIGRDSWEEGQEGRRRRRRRGEKTLNEGVMPAFETE
jgi:hypothetical protein